MEPICYSQQDENRALLQYYATSGGNFSPTFRDNLSVSTSGVKNQKNLWLSFRLDSHGIVTEERLYCSSHRSGRLWGPVSLLRVLQRPRLEDEHLPPSDNR